MQRVFVLDDQMSAELGQGWRVFAEDDVAVLLVAPNGRGRLLPRRGRTTALVVDLYDARIALAAGED